MKNALTQSSVSATLRLLSVNLTKKEGEYRVSPIGSKPGEGYFTNDLADAFATGKVMAMENPRATYDLPALLRLARLAEGLNVECHSIGAGMLASLVTEAKLGLGSQARV